jgi:hypothetical protein
LLELVTPHVIQEKMQELDRCHAKHEIKTPADSVYVLKLAAGRNNCWVCQTGGLRRNTTIRQKKRSYLTHSLPFFACPSTEQQSKAMPNAQRANVALAVFILPCKGAEIKSRK